MKNKKNAFQQMKNNKKWFLMLLLFAVLTGCKGNMTDRNAEVNDGVNQFSEDLERPDETLQNKEHIEKELAIDIDGDKIYPADTDILEEQKAGEWVYFRYMIKETYNNYEVSFPALFRYQEGTPVAQRVNDSACYSFDVVGDYVYYLDSTLAGKEHGVLWVMRSDGQEKRMLADELFDFQIVDDQYIYYTYSYDTVGAGLEGHALHRMNLDGSETMIAAYEASGVDFGVSHFEYKVVDGWVDCGTFKMELGEPADGFEKIVFYDIGDNDWVYYVTNRLMKARKDGSEGVELDGEDDYYYTVEKIEDDWIYYWKGGEKYRIKTDGSGKEAIGGE